MDTTGHRALEHLNAPCLGQALQALQILEISGAHFNPDRAAGQALKHATRALYHLA